jgi:hypothetical protein
MSSSMVQSLETLRGAIVGVVASLNRAEKSVHLARTDAMSCLVSLAVTKLGAAGMFASLKAAFEGASVNPSMPARYLSVRVCPRTRRNCRTGVQKAD